MAKKEQLTMKDNGYDFNDQSFLQFKEYAKYQLFIQITCDFIFCHIEMLTNANEPACQDLYAKTNQKPFYFCKQYKMLPNQP